MKKLLLVLVAFVGICLTSCGGFCEKSEANDTTACDTVDTVQVDTVAADSATLVDVE